MSGLFYYLDLDLLSNEKITSGAITKSNIESILLDNGNIELFFCPRDDCENNLVAFLDSAKESIHCALFDIGLESVQDKLLEKEKQMEVLIVTDDHYLKKFDHHFVRTDRSGLMHNKFCIIDGMKITSGSMNPTENGAHKNNNNLLFIESKILAQNYEEEFQEMWNGTFKKGDKVRNPNVMISDTKIGVYFCPDDQCALRVKEELKKATKEIYFMTFSFTHEGIANMLLLKHLDGIKINGVMEARQVTKHSQMMRLNNSGMDVLKDTNKQNLHHKVFIIDNKTVITGSFNPTNGGDKRNDENILIIEDEKIAKLFLEEFDKIHPLNN